METIKIISTANAGMLMELGENRLLIDAFHSVRYDLYQPVSRELFAKIKASPRFQDPNILFYTHCHPDHFCPEMTKEVSRLWPKTVTILPEPKADGILLSKTEETLSIGSLDLTFRRLTHEGEPYRTVPHYGILIQKGPLTVLDPGDCELASEELASFINGRHIDIAVLNFVWLTLRKGRQFVKEVIKPDHLLICHLPDPALDVFGYKSAVEKRILSGFPGSDIRIIERPLQEEIFTV